MSTVTLLIPDFDSAAIDGLRFWKLDYVEGGYVEALRLEFTEVVEEDGGETLVYRVWRNGETLSAMVPVVMERIQGYSDAVKVRPMLPSLGPGAYRISSFNAAGDSALSDDWLTL
jgi:hypothetical protein